MKYYCIEVKGFSDCDTEMQTILFGREAKMKNNEPIGVQNGKFSFNLPFLALKDKVHILLSTYPENSGTSFKIFYYGIREGK